MGNTHTSLLQQIIDIKTNQDIRIGKELTSIEMADNIEKPVAVWVDKKKVFYLLKHKINRDEIYEFDLYHSDKSGLITLIHSFQTFHPLNDSSSSVEYDESTVIFTFEIKSVPGKEDISQEIKFLLDFSKSFSSELDSDNQLKSQPFLLPSNRKIMYLNGEYSHYLIQVDANHYEFYIVESFDETPRGFESTFKRGDTVIKKINVESSNVPFVIEDENGNLKITSADKRFIPIEICLLSDDLTLAQVLGQETLS